MGADTKASSIRCKACTCRFDVPDGEKEVTCPGCGQGWKMRWFRPGVGMIIAPLNWTKYQKGNYSGRHHLDATNKMILYPLPHKSIEKKFFLLDSD